MLSRLAARLAAIEALAPFKAGATGKWPTIAGPRVYDSRQDPLDALDAIEGKPILIVYTEQSETAGYPKSTDVAVNGHHYVELTVECMIAARGVVEFEAPDGTIHAEGLLEAPIMERQHEALLDLLEATVRRRLFGVTDVGDPSSTLFRSCAWDVEHVNTVPMRDASRTVRLAARTIVFKVKIPGDKWPEPSLSYTPATGLDRLPDPLRLVAKYLDPSSSGGALCARMAELVADPAALTPLDLATLSAGLDRAFAVPSPADAVAQVSL